MSDRPRLLFISNLFPDADEPYRGLDNVTVLHQLRDRWDISVIALRPSLSAWWDGKQCWQPRLIDECFSPTFLPVRYVPKVGSRFNHWLIVQRLVPLLSQSTADVILSAWLYPDACAVVQSSHKPCVLIAQGSDVHQYLDDHVRRNAILDASSKASAIITRSRSLASLLNQAGVEQTRLHPIHNGVDTEVFFPSSKPEARSQLNLAHDRKLVLFVGNLLHVKNPHLLLRAFARLPENHDLVLAGKGPLHDELAALAAELGIATRTRFLGPQNSGQIAAWMRAADVLCMTSHNEGLPNVVLEARACGLPVVATDVGGIHEVIDDESKGFLTPPGDVDALVAALNKVITRNQSAVSGEDLSWRHCADQYDRLLLQARASR